MNIMSPLRQFVWSVIVTAITLSGLAHAKTADADPDEQTVEAAVILPKSAGVNIPGVPSVVSNTLNSNTSSQKSGATTNGTTVTTKKTADSGNSEPVSVPALTQPVMDTANILSAESQQVLTEKINALYQQNIAQIAILTIPSTKPEDIFSYSSRVFTQWQLGSKDKDNGLLIVVAPDDRQVQIMPGYGLEGTLPDIRNKQIIRDVMTPFFKQSDYGSGLEAGINTIAGYLTNDPTLIAGENDIGRQVTRNTGGNLGIFLIAGIGAFVVGAILKMFVGRFLSATAASLLGAGAAIGLGVGIVSATFFAFIMFVLLMMGIGNVLQLLMSSRGGFGGGGGFSGGGGSFGGGGASGSW